jgi:DnaJ-class molecular chaperone
VAPAPDVPGLGVGTPPAEVAAAYRRLAHTYHPDKMAGEPQEVREFAEQRMKETNAAYSELKQRGRSHA